MLSKSRRKALRALTAKKLCRYCRKPLGPHIFPDGENKPCMEARKAMQVIANGAAANSGITYMRIVNEVGVDAPSEKSS